MAHRGQTDVIKSQTSKLQLTPTDWRLPSGKINELQQASIEKLVALCKQSHFVTVAVRINGKWQEFQADWIKHLKPDVVTDLAEPEHAPEPRDG